MKFSTKAETLAALYQKCKTFSVLPQICITVEELATTSEAALLEKLQNMQAPYIVRSSALTEDTPENSNAGAFLSVKNVEKNQVFHMCKRVAASYFDANPKNQILIQPMLQHIKMCGVIFTIDPNTGGHYYVMNYDESGLTDSVTSGNGRNLKTYYLFRGKRSRNEMINKLATAANEICELFENIAIDIEFAVTRDEKIYILQARPLVLRVALAEFNSQLNALTCAKQYLLRELKPLLYVKGKKTIYSVMADWNPAEMIGIRPKPLALSLYKHLITDGVWAFQRDNYGYKNLRSFPLLRSFCGIPYIDTRVSFNSFVPKALNDSLTEKLVDYYLDRLAEKPENHDKVEFEIIYSCYTFDIKDRIKTLIDFGFSDSEIMLITEALKTLTNTIMNVQTGLWITDNEKIEELEKRQDIVLHAELDPVSKIYWLLEDCARYGTLPFAGLARAGFIAVQLLKSLVTVNVLTENDYYNFMSEVNTVSSQLVFDRNNLSYQAFLKKYGHLRPGTYDITSLRYDDSPDLYFGTGMELNKSIEKEEKHFPLKMTIDQYQAIKNLMEQNGFKGDVLDLFQFIKAGIEGRERSKFVFTKSVSEILDLIADLCESYGISREDASYLDIAVFDKLYASSQDIKKLLERSIEDGKMQYEFTLQTVLPPIIQSEEDVFSFEIPDLSANYITKKNAQGAVVYDLVNEKDLSGKILFISAADPGYDWIFLHNIAGFVTAYGGVNSHMAIRAGELCIPAAIGIGERDFNRYKESKIIRLDCANKRIEVLC